VSHNICSPDKGEGNEANREACRIKVVSKAQNVTIALIAQQSRFIAQQGLPQ
jgi:hypothetical protein